MATLGQQFRARFQVLIYNSTTDLYESVGVDSFTTRVIADTGVDGDSDITVTSWAGGQGVGYDVLVSLSSSLSNLGKTIFAEITPVLEGFDLSMVRYDLGVMSTVGATGTGSTFLAITVIADSEEIEAYPLGGAAVYIARPGEMRGPVLTNDDGVVTFPVNPGSWTVFVSADGVQSVTQAVTVPAEGLEVELIAEILSIPEPTAGEVTAQLVAYDEDNAVAAGIEFQFMLESTTAKTPGRSFPRTKREVTSGPGGVVSINLLQNAVYKARRVYTADEFGEWVTFTTGSVSPYTVPEILGKYLTGG